jgi:prepilin-type N-terminal cleavage/methylation domain-containing protein
MSQSYILTGKAKMDRQLHSSTYNKNKDKGFTLIEILIAISIFAIGFLAVASLQISAGKNNRTATEMTTAVNLASDQMERLINLAPDDSDLDPDPAANPHVDNQGIYNIQWIVKNTDLNFDGADDAKIINLTVSWTAAFSAGSSQREVNIDFIKPDI